MQVFVVMGNDYPSAAFSTVEAAEKYVDMKKKELPRLPRAPIVYWRVYEFTLDKEVNMS